jgi:hypothetical protein
MAALYENKKIRRPLNLIKCIQYQHAIDNNRAAGINALGDNTRVRGPRIDRPLSRLHKAARHWDVPWFGRVIATPRNRYG